NAEEARADWGCVDGSSQSDCTVDDRDRSYRHCRPRRPWPWSEARLRSISARRSRGGATVAHGGEGIHSRGEARRLRGRPWLMLGLDLIVLAGLVVLMCGVPWLDPGRYEGRLFGTFLVTAWCLGLMVWALGIVRQHGSRFTLRTLILLTAAVAVFLGLC